MRTLALLIVFCPMLSFGLDRLSALSMIETGNNDRMVGRAGEISRYQILKREWRSVTNSTRFTDPKVSETVTRALLDRRVATFKSIYGRNPNDFEFYALWNAPSQMYRGRVSPVVSERCRRFANLCQLETPSTPQVAAATIPTHAATVVPTAAPVAPTVTTVSTMPNVPNMPVGPKTVATTARSSVRTSAMVGTVMLARNDGR